MVRKCWVAANRKLLYSLVFFSWWLPAQQKELRKNALLLATWKYEFRVGSSRVFGMLVLVAIRLKLRCSGLRIESLQVCWAKLKQSEHWLNQFCTTFLACFRSAIKTSCMVRLSAGWHCVLLLTVRIISTGLATSVFLVNFAISLPTSTSLIDCVRDIDQECKPGKILWTYDWRLTVDNIFSGFSS